MGLRHPEAVSKRWAWFYCSIEITTDKGVRSVGNITATVTGGLIIVAIVFECELGYDRALIYPNLRPSIHR